MVGDTALSLTGLPAHPQDVEGRVASWIPRFVMLSMAGVGVLWWAMAGRPPHMPPPPPMGPAAPYPTAQPTAHPQSGSPDTASDILEGVADAAESGCDICDCMSGCDGCDIGACDCASLDCGSLDCGGLDCGGCDVSCNVANGRSVTRGVSVAAGKTCARRASPLHTAGTALALGAPLFVLAAWRRRRLRSTRVVFESPSDTPASPTI